jgi:hypothetical protein
MAVSAFMRTFAASKYIRNNTKQYMCYREEAIEKAWEEKTIISKK